MAFSPGQAHGKHRSLALLARHRHVTAHHARELAREGKAESRPAEALSGRGIGLAELLEQLSLLFRSHADAGVGDGKLDEAAAIDAGAAAAREPRWDLPARAHQPGARPVEDRGLKLELNPQTVQLTPLINEVIGTAGQLAEQNKNRLVVDSQEKPRRSAGVAQYACRVGSPTL
jgi:hypothetical protein